jgi:predicted GIY-YIG superfamily endonuclease
VTTQVPQADRADRGDNDSPCELYRVWSAAGDLLYVGISQNAFHRLSQHRSSSRSPWTAEMASFAIVEYPSRKAALEAERSAIKSESPKHNIVHRWGTDVPMGEGPQVSDDASTQEAEDRLVTAGFPRPLAALEVWKTAQLAKAPRLSVDAAARISVALFGSEPGAVRFGMRVAQ